MALLKCPGCYKSYKNDRGLSIHQRHCRHLEIMVKTRHRKRQLGEQLAHQSTGKKARDGFRERTSSFQNDLDAHTGASGKRKLSVSRYKYWKTYFYINLSFFRLHN